MAKIKNISGVLFSEQNKKLFTTMNYPSLEEIRRPEKTKNKLQAIINIVCESYLKKSQKIKSFFSGSSENKKSDTDIKKILETYR